jgi:putative NADPH-quinone reductase
VAIKNGQSIEIDNCITTIIYFLSFTVTILLYQTQLINTEILNDKIKRNNTKHLAHIYVFSGRRNQYTNTNAVFILTVTIPHLRFMIFNIDMICPIILYSVKAIRKHIAHDNVPRYNHRLRAFI